jgi:hypothetical protein
MLVRAILRGIADEIAIVTHIFKPSPLTNLVNKHNAIANNDDRLKKIYPETTGKELKELIALHEPETQIELLYGYIVDTRKIHAIKIDENNACELPTADTTDSANSFVKESTPIDKSNDDYDKNADDDREIKLYLIKTLVTIVVSTLSVILLGIFIYSLETNTLPNNEIIKAIFTTMVDIIKLIVLPSKD